MSADKLDCNDFLARVEGVQVDEERASDFAGCSTAEDGGWFGGGACMHDGAGGSEDGGVESHGVCGSERER